VFLLVVICFLQSNIGPFLRGPFSTNSMYVLILWCFGIALAPPGLIDAMSEPLLNITQCSSYGRVVEFSRFIFSATRRDPWLRYVLNSKFIWLSHTFHEFVSLLPIGLQHVSRGLTFIFEDAIVDFVTRFSYDLLYNAYSLKVSAGAPFVSDTK